MGDEVVVDQVQNDVSSCREQEKISQEDARSGKHHSSIPEAREDTESQDFNVERGYWSGKLDFFLSCLGYTIGLGNIWRFPYICYKNGGGAFLLPYFLFLLMCGIPLVFLELSLGQFAGQGPLGVWRLSPLFKGVGIGMVSISALVSVFYNMVLAWSLFYLFASMQSLPWTTCDNDWNTPACCERRVYQPNCSSLSADDIVTLNSSCFLCVTSANLTNTSSLLDSSPTALPGMVSNTTEFRSSAEEYFQEHVLDASSSIHHLGILWWPMVLCLLASWVLVLLCLLKGIKSTGKVVYFTAVFPYVMLLVLLIRTAMLDGSREGVIFYLQPRWDTLSDIQVWQDAASQVFFSLGACWGGLIALSSHNKFDHNCYRTAMILPIIDFLTSIFAGLVVFTALGHVAWRLETPVNGVVTSGPGLAFVAYPEALASMGGASVWSFLFFLMLLAVGLDTQFIFVSTVTGAIYDEFPAKLRKKRLWLIVGMCLLLFLCGLPLTSQAGIHIFEVVDRHSVGWTVFIYGSLECLVVSWVYGFQRFRQDIWTMIGHRPGKWWRIAWQFLTPAFCLAIFTFSLVAKIRDKNWEDEEKEAVSRVVVWILFVIGLLPVLAYGVYAVVVTPGTLKQRFRTLLSPSDDWGPSWSLADYKCQLLSLPDYMISRKEEGEEGVTNPAFKHRFSVSTDDGASDGGFTLSPPEGAQHGEDIDTGSITWSSDENTERGNWSGKYDYLFSMLGLNIGLGNLWRFPYLVFKNGGGAFFIPYLLMLVLCGIPLVLLEACLGQFVSQGALTVWRVCPLFKGLGYCTLLTTFCICLYYNVLNAWSLYYLVASLNSKLPWADCDNSWNTETCMPRVLFSNYTLKTCSPANFTSDGNTSIAGPATTVSLVDLTTSAFQNTSCVTNQTGFTTPSEEYFFKHVLKLSSGVDHYGAPLWPLALCLLFCWAITFLALIRGFKSAGKVAYFTVIFPYLILLVLMIRYTTIDTSAHLTGIRYFIEPKWSDLTKAGLWADAASQVFFSLSIGFGGVIAMSSYNRFHFNCFRDVYIACVLDTFMSAFAGFVVFAILGVLAKKGGMSVEDVVSSKFSLAYVTYPEAVAELPGSTLWAILFFLMLWSLGIDSQFLLVEALVVALIDEFPKVLAKRRLLLSGTLCAGMFLLALPMVTPGGLYIIVVLDYYVAAWAPLITSLLTCLVISWIYKLNNFSANVKAMFGHGLGLWWRMMWQFITPAILVFMLIFTWSCYTPPTADDYEYPASAHIVGWCLSFLFIVIIPAVAAKQLSMCGKVKGSFKERFLYKLRPDPAWGPALNKHRISSHLPGVVQLPEGHLIRTARWLETGQMCNDIFKTTTSASISFELPATPFELSPIKRKRRCSRCRKKRRARLSAFGSSKPGPVKKRKINKVMFAQTDDKRRIAGTGDGVIMAKKAKKANSVSTQTNFFTTLQKGTTQPPSLKKLCFLKAEEFLDLEPLLKKAARKRRQRQSRQYVPHSSPVRQEKKKYGQRKTRNSASPSNCSKTPIYTVAQIESSPEDVSSSSSSPLPETARTNSGSPSREKLFIHRPVRHGNLKNNCSMTVTFQEPDDAAPAAPNSAPVPQHNEMLSHSKTNGSQPQHSSIIRDFGENSASTSSDSVSLSPWIPGRNDLEETASSGNIAVTDTHTKL